MGRTPCCDKSKVKKGPWSIEEDEMLKNFIMNFGNGGNWISLPKKAGLNRCGKSCRLRWLNYLRPDIKHGNFKEEEDHLIYTLYHTIGSRWSVIASYLPGRTDNDVKNYWNTKLKRKILAGTFKNIFPNSDHITNDNQFQPQLSYDQSDEVYAKRGSLSQEICSHGDHNSDLSSSSSSSMNSSNNSGIEDEEFWMDLLSESFDDVVAGFLLEEKINEVASLLNV